MMKYIFCVVALLIQPVFSYIVYRKQDKDEAALKVPLLFFSGLYFVVQFFVFFKYLRYFPEDDQAYSYLIQAGILLVFLALEAALVASNRYIKRIDVQEKESISLYKEVLSAVQVELVLVKNTQNKDALSKLYNTMRTQNPVTHEAAYGETAAIKNVVAGISSVEDETEFRARCEQIKQLIEIRNIKNR